MSILSINKRAGFDYEVLDKYEAGLVLAGYEVKAVRAGNVNLKGSYITFHSEKAGMPVPYLTNAHISLYKYASTVKDYDPTRPRKILLKAKEVKHLMGKSKEQGLTIVPLSIYTKSRFLKLEFALARGKKKYDKREDLKKKDLEREGRAMMKRR
jgi:SsrA-binding protein